MGIYLQFPSGWWVILAIIYLPYILLFFSRKSYQNKKEIKTQLLFGVASLIIAFIIEVVAISLNVWTYFPGNWPIILWVCYFGGGLMSYQVIKKIEELFQ